MISQIIITVLWTVFKNYLMNKNKPMLKLGILRITLSN